MSASAERRPTELSADHPNLVVAAHRLRRSQWIWAGLFAGMGMLAVAASWPVHPLAIVPWFVTGLLLVLEPQPALLALVAIQWGLSLVALIPGAALAFGADPLSELLHPGPVEAAGLAIVRVVLLVTAWNQFMFFRMLYGTRGATGLDPKLAPIPQVVPNRSDVMAVAAGGLGAIGLVLAIAARSSPAGPPLLAQIGLLLASYALGLGLGAAFSPTSRRGVALGGVILGMAAYLLSLAASPAVAAGTSIGGS